MKKLFLLAAFFLCFGGCFSQGPGFIWAKSFGGVGSETGNAIATDGAGNIYSAGHFVGTTDFDPGAGTFTLTSKGMEDIFISKWDISGNFQWARSFGGNNSDYGYSISTDGTGNVYLAGAFKSINIVVGTTTITNLDATGNTSDIVVAKLDNLGNFVWLKSMGGIKNDEALQLAVDASGNVLTTGDFISTADFDPGPGTFTITTPSAGAWNTFISKLNSAGNFVWAKSLSGTSLNTGYCLTLDGAGNVFTGGTFGGSVDFDPGSGSFILTPAASTVAINDMFVSKLDVSGNFVWAKSMGGPGGDGAYGISLDVSGNVFTTGFYSGGASSDFDPGPGTFTLAAPGGAFVSKLDPLGNFVWAKSFSGGIYTGSSVIIDPVGSVYTTGWFDSFVDFDPGPGTYIMSGPGQNGYISKLDAAGNFVWASNIGGPKLDWTTSIASDVAGNAYIIGNFQSATATAGTYSLVNADISGSTYDVLIAKINIVTGIQESFGESLIYKVGPNPFSFQTTVYFNDEQQDASVRIINMIGEEIKTLNFTGKELIVEKESMKEGIYILEVKQKNQAEVRKKIIVE